jgi:hypothetical protein
MPQTKTLMDFSTSVFVYHLHAVRPYPEISCFTRPKAFTRSKDLTRALAPYTQHSCLTRPQALTRASAPYSQRSCLTRPQDLTRASALYTQLAALPGLRPLNLLNVAKQHLNAA